MTTPLYSFHVVSNGDGVILCVDGEIDLAARDAFTAAMENAWCNGVRLVLDLGGVTFMDSSGIACLAGASKRHGSIEALNVSPSVRELIQITGLDSVVHISP